MSVQADDKVPYILIHLDGTVFAFPVGKVQSILTMPPVTAVPKLPEHMRGTINFRGKVVPLLDLRRRLGLRSLRTEADELIRLLVQREQDHVNWLKEIESSALERRPFKLTTDPHKCAFGKWYDTYRTENQEIAFQMKRFDEPHKAIHAIAEKVIRHGNLGEHEAAAAVIQKTRDTELALMIRLFAKIRLTLKEELTEIVLVLDRLEGQLIAVAADQVISVEHLRPGSVEAPPPGMFPENSREELIQAIARRQNPDDQVVIICPDYLIK